MMVMWDRRKSSRYLWSALVITTFVVCGVIVYINFYLEIKEEFSFHTSEDFLKSPEMLTAEECVSVCDTKECVSQSKHILEYMDTSVDPCENFFQFLCGNVFEKLDTEKPVSYAELYDYMMSIKLKGILENLEGNNNNASGKAKLVYDSCMKYSSSDFQAIPTILEFLSGAGIRGWPHLSADFKFDDPNLSRVISYFLSYQEYGFIVFSADYPGDIFKKVGVKVNSSLSGVKSGYEEQKEHIRKYIVDRTLNYFDLDFETISRIWEESEAIHYAIKNLREESLKLQDKYEDEKIFLNCTEDTGNEWFQEDLCDCLKSIVDATNASETISKDFAEIEEYSVHFVQNIFPLLRNFSDTSVANYLALNLFFNNSNELNMYFHLLKKKILTMDEESIYLERMRIKDIKWTNCVNWLFKHMVKALGHEYIMKDFPVSFIQDVWNISNEIISEGAYLTSRQDWMNENEKALMNEKIYSLRFNYKTMIEILTDEEGINTFYEMFQPTDESFFQNVLRHKKWWKALQLQGKINNYEISQYEHILTTYAQTDDIIEVYLAFFMPPTYTPHLERFMNLLAVGETVAHEFGHRLDDHIRFLMNESKYFQDHFDCLADQQSNFFFETLGENANGSRYLDETFADTISISILDKIIEKYASNYSLPSMPSLSFPLKQQMYINAMHVYCSVHTKESDEFVLKIDTHNADRFRLLGMMQNSKRFSEVFGCTKGSYMNPLTKCSLLG